MEGSRSLFGVLHSPRPTCFSAGGLCVSSSFSHKRPRGWRRRRNIFFSFQPSLLFFSFPSTWQNGHLLLPSKPSRPRQTTNAERWDNNNPDRQTGWSLFWHCVTFFNYTRTGEKKEEERKDKGCKHQRPFRLGNLYLNVTWRWDAFHLRDRNRITD